MENNLTINHYQYLVIGGGLAGCLFAFQLYKNNKSFLMFDPNHNHTSSKIAAGMFNPISGKRMSINWKVNELLAELTTTFKELEQQLNRCFIIHEPIQQIFGNNKEANDFGSRKEDENFKKFITDTPLCEPNLIAPNGCFEVGQGGWVDTRKFIESYTNFLLQNNKLLQEELTYEQLVQTEKNWQYKSNTFNCVICCDGYQAIHNSLLNWLPFKLCKGELLLIHCPGLNAKKIVKKGVYLVNLGNDLYKAGATYEWDNINENYTEKGKLFLIEKLESLLNLPFKVVEQYAGVRPTTRDRNAILGAHPQVKNFYIFNGLGTKGVLQAPFLARQLFEHIELQKDLDKEIDIKRFYSCYPTT